MTDTERSSAAPDHASRPDHGLSAAQVADRVAAGQVNITSNASSRSGWQIVRSNTLTRFNAILGALFLLVMVAGSFADGLSVWS